MPSDPSAFGQQPDGLTAAAATVSLGHKPPPAENAIQDRPLTTGTLGTLEALGTLETLES
jgi:hypothetical protein